MELWEAAAGVIIGLSSAFGAWKGAAKKAKGIEEQLRPANGSGTLANEVHGIAVKLGVVHEDVLKTHHIACKALELGEGNEQKLDLLAQHTDFVFPRDSG